MEAINFIKRRENLLASMVDQSVTIVYAGIPLRSSADGLLPFVVNRNFFYLTNITQENSILVILKNGGSIKVHLFIDEFDELKERWTGKRLTLEEARALSGIGDVFLTKNFELKLNEYLALNSSYGQITTLYLDLEKDLVIGPSYKTTRDLKEELAQKYQHFSIDDIYRAIILLRMVKSPEEVESIKKAIQITHHGLQQIRSKLRPNLYEYQIEGLFEFAIKDHANASLAFETIIASGVNGTILHYPHPKDKIADGALVLCDLGAAYQLYNADITRTYPAAGKFNNLQKDLYEIVLKTNKHIINFARPGLKLLDLQMEAIKVLTKECLDRELIKDPSELAKYYYHGVSHHLGLDTHDPSDRELPLVPGNIITVEPGLYFKQYGIGIRIEDDILITENGAENLSHFIPKEIKDLER